MMTLIALSLLVITAILIFIYFTNPSNNLIRSFYVQGVRLNISLDEIFNKVVPSEKVEISAILDANSKLIWSHTNQLNLSSEYYNVKTYILILETPVELKLDSLSLYQRGVAERFEFILKRTNVFIALTDVNGQNITMATAHANKTVFILLLSVFTIASVLYLYLHSRNSIKPRGK